MKLGRPRKPKDERLTPLHVRLSKADIKSIKTFSGIDGLTASGYIRKLIDQDRKNRKRMYWE